jgi:hypothetical protein
MYETAMTAIDRHLVQKSPYANLIYTAELVPERDRQGQMFVLGSPSSLLIANGRSGEQHMAADAKAGPPRVFPWRLAHARRRAHSLIRGGDHPAPG